MLVVCGFRVQAVHTAAALAAKFGHIHVIEHLVTEYAAAVGAMRPADVCMFCCEEVCAHPRVPTTLLHAAASSNQAAVVFYLLAHGAVPGLPDRVCIRGLFVCVTSDHLISRLAGEPQRSSRRRNAPTLEYRTVDCGSGAIRGSLSTQVGEDRRALCAAECGGRVDALMIPLTLQTGYTAFHTVCDFQNLEAMQWLLAHGSNIDLTDAVSY